MAASASDDPDWADFPKVRFSIKGFTVDRLKQIIAGLSEENGVALQKSGRKQELITRIETELDKYRYMRSVDHWKRARAVLQQVQVSGGYSSSGLGSQSFSASSGYGSNSGYGSSYNIPKPSFSVQQQSPSRASSSSMGRYDPYAPPRMAHNGPASVPPVKASFPPIRFKSSPFHRAEQAVSSVVECPESTSSMDRRTQSFQFSLTQEQIAKLSQPDKKYQLRLYCTSSAFYSNSTTGFRSTTSICPIEFPGTCEVRVNSTLLSANLKGIKKKPGTAPPADISKVVKMTPGSQNRVEMIYVNSQPNSSNAAANVTKKYYLMVYLVEVSSVDQLVDRLKKGKFRTVESIKTQLEKDAAIDDDIEMGKSTLTLKCPLSYTRITVPARSEQCVHSQCFDAVSWYSVMEQTTTWLCPVCEKMINPEELIVDGFFQSIVRSTPDSVDDVELEPNGEWHTADNKYGSQKWMEQHGKPVQNGVSLPKPVREEKPNADEYASDEVRVKAEPGEVLILDSDSENEDEFRVKKELSPSNGVSSSSGSVPVKSSGGVIDLTLDSDDDDPVPIVSAPAKRKAPEDISYSSQKKGRLDVGPPAASPNGVRQPSDPFISRPLPPPIPRQTSSPLTSHSSPSTAFRSAHLPPIPYVAPNGSYTIGSYPQTSAGNDPPRGTYGAEDEDSRRRQPNSASVYSAYRPGANGGNGASWP